VQLAGSVPDGMLEYFFQPACVFPLCMPFLVVCACERGIVQLPGIIQDGMLVYSFQPACVFPLCMPFLVVCACEQGIVQLAGIIPDGMLVFLSSYLVVDKLQARWKVGVSLCLPNAGLPQWFTL